MTPEQLIPVIKMLSKKRFDLSNEKATQRDIEAALIEMGIAPGREYHLNDKDIPDFFLFDNTAVEVKIKGGARSIYKQCERYCQHDQVKYLLLLTNKAMGMPGQINNKPIYVINLGKAWL